MTARCPDCGRNVPTIFQHIDADCTSDEFDTGWVEYQRGVGLFKGMRRYTGESQDRYIQGWHAADDVKSQGEAT